MAEFDLTVKEEDRRWISANHPALTFSFGQDGVLDLSGDLNFRMLYKADKSGSIINPAEEHLSLGLLIKDSYQIKIKFKKGRDSNLPEVSETGLRIETSSQKWNRDKEDLHAYTDNVCCLCMKMEERENLPIGFNLPDFFHNLLTPFFYAQSYFEENGSWPWGDYSHGVYGAFEWYFRKDKLSDEEKIEFIDFLKEKKVWVRTKELLSKGPIKADSSCICGRRKIKSCHPNVLLALWKMSRNMGDFRSEI